MVSHVQCQRLAVADSLAARRSLSWNDEPAICMRITHRVARAFASTALVPFYIFSCYFSLFLSPFLSIRLFVVKNTAGKTDGKVRSVLRSLLRKSICEYYFHRRGVADALKNFINDWSAGRPWFAPGSNFD